MGVQPPFLYERPQQYSFVGPSDKAFDPKAVTRASWTSIPAAPKRNGPLIDPRELNRHPDTYFSAPYGNLNWKPMSRNTKTTVKWTRITLLLLRILSLLCAMALLFCVIVIQLTPGGPGDNPTDIVIRVAPGVTILHTIYAVYHLSRSSAGRTPASSASYMMFAAIIDSALIPFFVFTALVAHNQAQLSFFDPARWHLIILNDHVVPLFAEIFFDGNVFMGGLHTVTLSLSIFLAVIFKKIDKLPPDMNPLEENLTSRHKRNKSSLSLAMSDVPSSRDSHLSAPLMDEPRKPVPFMHTRNNSSQSVPLSNQYSPPRQSPQIRNPPPANSSNRNSRMNPSSALYSQVPSEYSAHVQTSPPRSYDSSPTRELTGRPHSQTLSPARPVTRHSVTESTVSENWESIPSPPPELQHLREQEHSSPPKRNNLLDRPVQPLAMNPPTPPINSSPARRALGPATGNGNGSPATFEEINFKSTHPHAQRYNNAEDNSDLGRVGSKVRFYGRLRGNRVVSSGLEKEEGGWMRKREVSGKKAEEGRAG